MAFSNQLKRAMNEKEITQKQLSTLTSIGKSSISQYVSGTNVPNAKYLKLISDALDQPEFYFFLDEDTVNDSVVNLKNISIAAAAELMGKSEQFVRVGLQREILPFGAAVKISNRYTYYISPKLFYEYTGMRP